jgi:hypothetical protein
MNYFKFTKNEAIFLLFAFEKTLANETEISSEQRQFYEHSIKELESKLARFEAGKNGRPSPSPRSPTSKIPKSWPNQ